MTYQEIQEQIESLDKVGKKYSQSPEMALRFLIEAGILPEGSKVIKKRKPRLKRESLLHMKKEVI